MIVNCPGYCAACLELSEDCGLCKGNRIFDNGNCLCPDKYYEDVNTYP